MVAAKNLRFDEVHVSHLRRAKQTMEILLKVSVGAVHVTLRTSTRWCAAHTVHAR